MYLQVNGDAGEIYSMRAISHEEYLHKNELNILVFVIRVEICLEVGAGSGVVSAFLASMIGPQALYM